MDENGTGGERFYDRDAEAEVTGKIVQQVTFRMRAGDQCTARGVMLMSDGRVYICTERAERHADVGSGRTRLASLSRQSFAATAVGLLEFERDRIEPGLMDGYRAQIDAL
jgi:hypothetical protein